MERQIKNRKRVSDYGEVFTAKRQVIQMADLVKEPVLSTRTTVLEPACGNGNFLSEILARRLACIYRQDQEQDLERSILLAVSSLYGIDIQKDNVLECRERLFKQVIANKSIWPPLFLKALQDILKRNIICGNSLTMQKDNGTPLVISEWDIRENGTVVRKDVYYHEMIKNVGESHRYIRTRYCRWAQEQTALIA